MSIPLISGALAFIAGGLLPWGGGASVAIQEGLVFLGLGLVLSSIILVIGGIWIALLLRNRRREV